MEEYDMPPEPPIPEPIIPSALYYELPAGLMAPLVGVRLTDLPVLYLRCRPQIVWETIFETYSLIIVGLFHTTMLFIAIVQTNIASLE